MPSWDQDPGLLSSPGSWTPLQAPGLLSFPPRGIWVCRSRVPARMLQVMRCTGTSAWNGMRNGTSRKWTGTCAQRNWPAEGSCRGFFAVEELISVPKGSLARGFHGGGSAALPPQGVTRPTGMCCHLRALENDGKREQGERWKDKEHAPGVRRKGKAAVWPLLAPRGKIPGTLCMLEASAATAKKAHRMQINHCVRSTPEEHPARGARGKGADSLPSDRQR